MINIRSRKLPTLRQGFLHVHSAIDSKKRSILSHKPADPVLVSKSQRQSGGYLFAKHVIDFSAGLIALILLSPLMLIISILIKIDSPGNVHFLQQRVGKDGKYFTIFKYRTLYVEHFGILPDREAPYDYSITRIGKYLRRYKLDEIPQFINVILGNMSIVGPRPDIPVQVDQYIAPQRDRLQVKPGLTGVSQVSGNTLLSWPERILLDIWYIQNRTLLLDMKIIGHTLVTIVKGETLSTDPFNVHRLLPGKTFGT